jgi:superfamily I DNA/RNA helicase
MWKPFWSGPSTFKLAYTEEIGDAINPPESAIDETAVLYRDEDYVILSTIHSANRQQFGSVFMLGTVDGCIPSDLGVGTADDVEEERQLPEAIKRRALAIADGYRAAGLLP